MTPASRSVALSSKSVASTMKNDPICSFVSVKGPSVIETLPFLGRKDFPARGDSREAVTTSWPLLRSAAS